MSDTIEVCLHQDWITYPEGDHYYRICCFCSERLEGYE